MQQQFQTNVRTAVPQQIASGDGGGGGGGLPSNGGSGGGGGATLGNGAASSASSAAPLASFCVEEAHIPSAGEFARIKAFCIKHSDLLVDTYSGKLKRGGKIFAGARFEDFMTVIGPIQALKFKARFSKQAAEIQSREDDPEAWREKARPRKRKSSPLATQSATAAPKEAAPKEVEEEDGVPLYGWSGRSLVAALFAESTDEDNEHTLPTTGGDDGKFEDDGDNGMVPSPPKRRNVSSVADADDLATIYAEAASHFRKKSIDEGERVLADTVRIEDAVSTSTSAAAAAAVSDERVVLNPTALATTQDNVDSDEDDSEGGGGGGGGGGGKVSQSGEPEEVDLPSALDEYIDPAKGIRTGALARATAKDGAEGTETHKVWANYTVDTDELMALAGRSESYIEFAEAMLESDARFVTRTEYAVASQEAQKSKAEQGRPGYEAFEAILNNGSMYDEAAVSAINRKPLAVLVCYFGVCPGVDELVRRSNEAATLENQVVLQKASASTVLNSLDYDYEKSHGTRMSYKESKAAIEADDCFHALSSETLIVWHTARRLIEDPILFCLFPVIAGERPLTFDEARTALVRWHIHRELRAVYHAARQEAWVGALATLDAISAKSPNLMGKRIKYKPWNLSENQVRKMKKAGKLPKIKALGEQLLAKCAADNKLRHANGYDSAENLVPSVHTLRLMSFVLDEDRMFDRTVYNGDAPEGDIEQYRGRPTEFQRAIFEKLDDPANRCMPVRRVEMDISMRLYQSLRNAHLSVKSFFAPAMQEVITASLALGSMYAQRRLRNVDVRPVMADDDDDKGGATAWTIGADVLQVPIVLSAEAMRLAIAKKLVDVYEWRNVYQRSVQLVPGQSAAGAAGGSGMTVSSVHLSETLCVPFDAVSRDDKWSQMHGERPEVQSDEALEQLKQRDALCPATGVEIEYDSDDYGDDDLDEFVAERKMFEAMTLNVSDDTPNVQTVSTHNPNASRCTVIGIVPRAYERWVCNLVRAYARLFAHGVFRATDCQRSSYAWSVHLGLASGSRARRDDAQFRTYATCIERTWEESCFSRVDKSQAARIGSVEREAAAEKSAALTFRQSPLFGTMPSSLNFYNWRGDVDAERLLQSSYVCQLRQLEETARVLTRLNVVQSHTLLRTYIRQLYKVGTLDCDVLMALRYNSAVFVTDEAFARNANEYELLMDFLAHHCVVVYPIGHAKHVSLAQLRESARERFPVCNGRGNGERYGHDFFDGDVPIVFYQAHGFSVLEVADVLRELIDAPSATVPCNDWMAMFQPRSFSPFSSTATRPKRMESSPGSGFFIDVPYFARHQRLLFIGADEACVDGRSERASLQRLLEGESPRNLSIEFVKQNRSQVSLTLLDAFKESDDQWNGQSERIEAEMAKRATQTENKLVDAVKASLESHDNVDVTVDMQPVQFGAATCARKAAGESAREIFASRIEPNASKSAYVVVGGTCKPFDMAAVANYVAPNVEAAAAALGGQVDAAYGEQVANRIESFGEAVEALQQRRASSSVDDYDGLEWCELEKTEPNMSVTRIGRQRPELHIQPWFSRFKYQVVRVGTPSPLCSGAVATELRAKNHEWAAHLDATSTKQQVVHMMHGDAPGPDESRPRSLDGDEPLPRVAGSGAHPMLAVHRACAELRLGDKVLLRNEKRCAIVTFLSFRTTCPEGMKLVVSGSASTALKTMDERVKHASDILNSVSVLPAAVVPPAATRTPKRKRGNVSKKKAAAAAAAAAEKEASDTATAGAPLGSLPPVDTVTSVREHPHGVYEYALDYMSMIKAVEYDLRCTAKDVRCGYFVELFFGDGTSRTERVSAMSVAQAVLEPAEVLHCDDFVELTRRGDPAVCGAEYLVVDAEFDAQRCEDGAAVVGDDGQMPSQAEQDGNLNDGVRRLAHRSFFNGAIGQFGDRMAIVGTAEYLKCVANQ